jgi:hypothetical protein
MPEDMYLKILYNLFEIEYAKDITYSRYNEPLSNKEIILQRISQARKILPKANLKTNTNGDYISLDYIKELRDNGLNELFIQQYLGNNEMYNHNKMKEKILSKIYSLKVDYSIISEIDNQRIEYSLDIPNIRVHIRGRNFGIEGCPRTEKVKNLNKEYIRYAPCVQPFNHMYIDYNGYVMICCNTRSDIAEHKHGIMGDVSKQNLWDIYCNSKYNSWREHLKNYSQKEGICKNCKVGINFRDYNK